jgi:hypothetical protein
LEPLQKHNGANGAATQLSQLSLEPSQQAPLSIQTSIPAPLPPSIQGGVYHQGVQPVYQLPQQVSLNSDFILNSKTLEKEDIYKLSSNLIFFNFNVFAVQNQ